MVKLGPVNCGAYIDVSTTEGRRRVCVLAGGHYCDADDRGGSWHTDCPDVAGQSHPHNSRHDHIHQDMPREACVVWADHADGAHVSDIASAPATDEESGRTLIGDRPVYRADLVIGHMSLSVHGPTEFIAHIITEAAAAFEAETER